MARVRMQSRTPSQLPTNVALLGWNRILMQDFVAQADALVADEHAGAGDQPHAVACRLPAERAALGDISTQGES